MSTMSQYKLYAVYLFVCVHTQILSHAENLDPISLRMTVVEDKSLYKALLGQQITSETLQYTRVDSLYINGALYTESLQKVVESRVDGLMRTENIVIDVYGDGTASAPLVMIYDHSNDALFYQEGERRARAVKDETVRMGEDLYAVKTSARVDRYDIVKLPRVPDVGTNIEVFAKYELTKIPGLWTTVWVDSKTGLETLLVTYSPQGMLSLIELRDIKIDEPVSQAAIYEDFGPVDGVPEMSYLEFLDDN